MYTLTKEMLKIVDTHKMRLKLAEALNTTENTIRNYVSSRSDNLTKFEVLLMLQKERQKETGELKSFDQLVTQVREQKSKAA